MFSSSARILLRNLSGWTAVLTALAVQGFFREPKEVRPSYHRIPSPKLNQRIRIVHLTDLHLDWDKRRDYVPLMVNQQDPDLILMTGDYLNKARFLYRLEDFVNQFEAKYGVYASFGNWDAKKKASLFGKTKVTPLNNSNVEIEIRKDQICLVGIDYPISFEVASLLKSLNNHTLNILLHHSPDLIEEIALYGNVDLYLAGHTHGGQVRVPFLKGLRKGFKGKFPYAGAIVTSSKHGSKYESGMFEVHDTTLYVNRGVGMEGGFAPRVRLFCPPEIAVFDIVPDSYSASGHPA